MKNLYKQKLIALIVVFFILFTSISYGLSTSSPFSNVEYKSYIHNTKFSDSVILNGVDMSDWQSKNSDFSKAKGVDFVILRISYTSLSKNFSTHYDDNFVQLYRKAKANGLLVGVYVFSQAKSTSEAIKEAQFALKRLKALGIKPEDLDLPVYMDYEFAYLGRLNGTNRSTTTNSAVAFCNTIKTAGYKPGIYANTSFYNSNLDTSKFTDVDFWCAQYYNKCTSSVNYTKWQYSSKAKISGLLSYTGKQGNVDVNFWYLSNKPTESRFKIYGETEYEDINNASFDIYNGETLLREGKDYKLHLIKNQNKNYAYIKGKGIYDGYALIPLKSISSIPENNEEDKPESKEIVCANYLSNTTNALSRYITSSVSVNKVKIKSLKKYKKAFKVILTKNKNVSGYEIRYSQNKNMDSCTLKNIGKSTSKKFKVKRKTTYYVQARAYKDVNGIRYYSGWSAAKKVKTK